MTFDVHAHCIPPSFRSWLERSGPVHGAELGEDNPVAPVDAVPGLEPMQREAIMSGNSRRLFG
jgi:hypothetical protein